MESDSGHRVLLFFHSLLYIYTRNGVLAAPKKLKKSPYSPAHNFDLGPCYEIVDAKVFFSKLVNICASRFVVDKQFEMFEKCKKYHLNENAHKLTILHEDKKSQIIASFYWRCWFKIKIKPKTFYLYIYPKYTNFFASSEKSPK